MQVKRVFGELWKIIYPCLIYLAVLNCVAAAGSQIFSDEWYNSHTMLVSCISMAVSIPVLIWIYWKDYKQMPYFFGKSRKPALWIYAAVGTGSLVLAFILNLLITLTKIQEIFPEYQNTAVQMYQENGIFVLLATLVLAPVMEELVFRGICFGRIRKFADKKMTIILSALLFGIYHMNLVQFIYAFLMGLVFAAIYEKYRNIVLTVTAHIFANLCAVLLSISSLHF